MARSNAYTSTVAARTRAAQTILENPEMLARYEADGGLKEDLEQIVAAGLKAEAANRGQSLAAGESEGATTQVLLSFENLRQEYSSVMGVAQAVRGDLVRKDAAAPVLANLDQIITNEVPVRIVATKTAAGATKKKARKVESFEAIRAEIHKDAGALLALKDAAEAFARRRVTAQRLTALEEAAAGLSGKVGERAALKGASKSATQAEHDAVKEQKDIWASSYRILAQVGQADARVAELLKQAARAR